MTEELDVLKFVTAAVQEVVGEQVWVADRLPPAANLESALPCVVIDLLPGKEQRSWGGEPGDSVVVDLVALDVDVVAGSRAEATPLAHRVRLALHQLPHLDGSGVKFVDCPRFSTREDINYRVRVLGVVAELTIVG